MKLPITKEQHTRLLPQIFIVSFTLLLAAFLWNFKTVWGFICSLFKMAEPFFIGFAIAYLLFPIQGALERLMRRIFKKDCPRTFRLISTLLSLIFLVAIVVFFISILLPQVIDSVKSIVSYITDFLKTNSGRLNQVLLKYEWLSFDGSELVVAWENIVSSQMKNITTVVENVWNISGSIVEAVYNLLVGAITSIYLLTDKERLIAHFKKLGYAFMKRDHFDGLIFWTRRANKIFTGFLFGKIIDSAIIGLLCYFGMLMFKMEYPLLISVIIGVTNIIPFFGPFIGAVPSILILLMINPMSALWFTIFVFVLQQLDGNVIGPHILGDYVGVSALSIMIAIVIGGGLFGFAGMLLGVPVYALCYAIIKTIVFSRLRAKNLTTDSAAYVHAPETLKETKNADDSAAE